MFAIVRYFRFVPVFCENIHTLIGGLAGCPGKHETSDLMLYPHPFLNRTATNTTVASDHYQVSLTNNPQPVLV